MVSPGEEKEGGKIVWKNRYTSEVKGCRWLFRPVIVTVRRGADIPNLKSAEIGFISLKLIGGRGYMAKFNKNAKEAANCYICRNYEGYGICKIKDSKDGVPACDLKKTGCCRLDNEAGNCTYFEPNKNLFVLVPVCWALAGWALGYLVFKILWG